MDDNSKQIRRCGQFGEGVDDEVSMEDVLEEHQRLQADASAVLGGSDPNNCTYPKGYSKRQALYACATCTPNGNAGICLACSYACHEGHDLYELYTKRFFRCDCGNDKFSGKECKLIKDKEMSSRNRYNQNFKGLYCSCARPYPDAEDPVEDEMIQCVICEDWHHGRHLKTPLPEDFSEMTCPECMAKFPFLWAYHVFSVIDVVKKEEIVEEHTHLDVENSESNHKTMNGNMDSLKEVSSSEKNSELPANSACVDNSCVSNVQGTSQNALNGKRKRDESSEEELREKKITKMDQSELKVDGIKADDIPEEGCLLQSLQKRKHDILEQAVFWPEGWRSKLCKCQECLDIFKDKEIDFLLDESDTIQAYEETGTQNGTHVSEEEAEENLFAGMHHVQQIEIAQGVRDLKTNLNEFLQGFAREGKVVTETDVREFFQSLEEKRRRRMNMPQNDCR